MSEKAQHVAARVDVGLETTDPRYSPSNPNSTDAFDWARAFIASGDVSVEAIHRWFHNAMWIARCGYYDPDPPRDDD